MAKQIRFAPQENMTQIRRISNFTGYSEEEITAYWGESDEMGLRKQELRENIQQWRQGRRASDNLDFTTLGIMDKIGDGRKDKKEHRENYLWAVLDEQDLQYAEGIYDDELMSEACRQTSSKSKDKAQREALRLHKEVQQL